MKLNFVDLCNKFDVCQLWSHFLFEHVIRTQSKFSLVISALRLLVGAQSPYAWHYVPWFENTHINVITHLLTTAALRLLFSFEKVNSPVLSSSSLKLLFEISLFSIHCLSYKSISRSSERIQIPISTYKDLRSNQNPVYGK